MLSLSLGLPSQKRSGTLLPPVFTQRSTIMMANGSFKQHFYPEQMFADLAILGREYEPRNGSNQAIAEPDGFRDAQGYPTALPPGADHYWRLFSYERVGADFTSVDAGTRYRLTWDNSDGSGENGNRFRVIGNVSNVTEDFNARVVEFDLDGPAAQRAFRFEQHVIIPGSHPVNVRLYQIRDEAAILAYQQSAGSRYLVHPRFRTTAEQVCLWRAMQDTEVNRHNLSSFDDIYNAYDYYTQAGRMAPRVIAEVCNQMRWGFWLPIPHRLDQAGCERFFDEVDPHLRDELDWLHEYSNEAWWNDTFTNQNGFLRRRSIIETAQLNAFQAGTVSITSGTRRFTGTGTDFTLLDSQGIAGAGGIMVLDADGVTERAFFVGGAGVINATTMDTNLQYNGPTLTDRPFKLGNAFVEAWYTKEAIKRWNWIQARRAAVGSSRVIYNIAGAHQRNLAGSRKVLEATEWRDWELAGGSDPDVSFVDPLTVYDAISPSGYWGNGSVNTPAALGRSGERSGHSDASGVQPVRP